jgi:hypothetical protein
MKTPEAWADAAIEQIWPGDPFSGPWKQAVAQAIREAVEGAAPRWIPVGERLPDVGDIVQIYDPAYDYPHYAQVEQGREGTMIWVELIDHHGMFTPTHWAPAMLLPDPR